MRQTDKGKWFMDEAVVFAPATWAALSAWACALGQRWVAAEQALG